MEEENPTKLIAEEGILKGKVLELKDAESWIIGRDPEQCNIVLEDPTASRQHLRIYQSEDEWVAENLSDTNPIQINDTVVEDSSPITKGDTIQIGDGSFRFAPSNGAHPVTKEDVSAVDETLIPDERPESGSAGVPPPSTEQDSEEQTSEEESLEEEPLEEQEETTDTEQPVASEEDEENLEEEELKPSENPITEEEVFAGLDLDLSQEGRWMLKVISGPNNGAEFSMESQTSYVIGNDPATCDLVFHDISVSRKHARISVDREETLTIEDLNSRNGTQVEGESIDDSVVLKGNQLITLGTSTFVVIDRDGERDTIVSPPLASLSKVLQDPATIEATQAAVQEGVPSDEETDKEDQQEQTAVEEPQKESPYSWALIGAATGFALVLGWGVTSLFQEAPIQQQEYNSENELTGALVGYPSVQYSFSKATGTLLLLGHVSTGLDRSQILYNIQELPFVKKIDDNIVIDELVWQETNRVLSKNPIWRSVTVSSPSPAKFVVTGYLSTRKDAEQLSDYLSLNFRYPELLENKVVVEENLLRQIEGRLLEERLVEITGELRNGELQLYGVVGFDKVDSFRKLLDEFAQIQGIRQVRNFVSEVEPQAALIDLSDNYEVTGFTDVGGVTVSVVIDGKILAKGDRLDGMQISEIKDHIILLEKDGFKYKISFKR